LLALHFRSIAGAPIVLASNRDESRDRPTAPPQLHSGGDVEILCGSDRRAGGTWLGVNQYSVVVAVTNRPQPPSRTSLRSRGLLALDLLKKSTASHAAELALSELSTGRYAGANFLVADANEAAVCCGDDAPRIVPLAPGLHLLTAGDPDDPADLRQQTARRLLAENGPDQLDALLRRAEKVFSGHVQPMSAAQIVLRHPSRTTVSSTVLAIADERHASVYRYAPGPPDVTPYDDYSALLRAALARHHDAPRT
jgi:uncharacterized protein with NRDE domain